MRWGLRRQLQAFPHDALPISPHMFPCHRSHSWLSGGDHFLVKNPYVLAFGIFENDHSWLFSTDRKSTRLNSSHVEISYAVFCSKKKKADTRAPQRGTGWLQDG